MVARTLKSSREIDLLFREGKRAANKYVVILAGRTPEGRGPAGRVVFIAGKKTGGAVTRNRAKRVLRASVGRLRSEWPGWDVAIIARATTATAPPAVLDKAIAEGLGKVGFPHA